MKYQWVVLSVTTVGIFMAGLDTRIVLIGLPTIGFSLHADLETLLWMTQGYQFAVTIGLLFLGRLTDMFGRVRIYNLGFIIFTIGSGLCSLSQTGEQLILFRVIQGIGGSMLIANSAAIITDATPYNELGFSLGINQIALTLGAVLGLTVGGVLIDSPIGWRSIFYLNLPIGIFGTIWAYLRLREISKLSPHSKFDYAGAALFITGLTSLLFDITLYTIGTLNLLTTGVLFILSLACFGLFIRVETHQREPMLDLSMFKIRLFSAGNLSQLLFSLGFGSLGLIVIFYLQLVRGFDALIAGLAFLPLDVSFSTVGPISGRLSDRYGARGFSTLGLGIASVGYVLLSFIGADTPILQLELVLVVIGAGLGLFSSPNISSIMGSVPPERRGIASAVRATLFNTGSVVSLSIVAAIITTAIPYSTVSGIITGGYTSLTPLETVGFVIGLRRAFLASFLITIPAIIASSLRGPRNQSSNHARISENAV